MRPTVTRLSRIGRRLALLCLALGFALGLAELALRWLAPQPVFVMSSRTYAPDPPGRYGLRAGYRGRMTNRVEFDNEVVISSQGMRGRELGAKVPGRPRVLFLGDSFTFGVGVAEHQTFPQRVQSGLALRGIAIEAVNAGIPGFGTVDEATWLELHGAMVDPDLIVLAVFLGNDIQNAEPSYLARRIDDDHGDITGETHDLRTWLYYHSHLFLLVKHSIPRPLMNRLRNAIGLESWFAQNTIDELSPCALQPPLWVADAVAATANAIDRLQTFAARAEVPLYAVLLPDVTEVDPAAWNAALGQLGLDPRGYDVARGGAWYVNLLAARAIPTLDLRPALRAALEIGMRPYYVHDRHFTLVGQALVGDEIARFVGDRAATAPEGIR